MEAVDSHGDGVKPFFDVVSVGIVELTAQLVTREGSQVANSIHEKLSLGNSVFVREPMDATA